MKILHLIYTHGISGAEKYLKHLLPGLIKHDIEPHLFIICPPQSAGLLNEFAKSLNNAGVITTICPAKRRFILITIKKINQYIKHNAIKVMHSHLLNTDLYAALVKKIFNKKIILISTKHGYQEKTLQVYEPGNPVIFKNLYYYITKFTLKFIDKNIAVSQGISDLYFALGFTKKKFPVLHHGVTINYAKGEEPGVAYRKANPQLIIVGRIEQFKGHHFLIEAMVDIVKQFPSCKLLILGEGSAKENIREKAIALGISAHIDFMGFQQNPYAFISHSDIVVLPSLFEPFGLVYIEAFALKKPVVAFDTPAGNEIMEHGVTAYLVPKGNVELLSREIIYLLQNKQELERIAANAYTSYQQKFTTEIMIENTVTWYKKEIYPLIR